LQHGAAALQRQWLPGAESQLDRVSWVAAGAVIELLLSAEAERLRLCASHDCGWLFLDVSRNGRRRWCSMAACGNVEKARRFRSRAGSGH
jgi:predicted RNA-binding Zn ribbon-like protein